jgi:hypothetical protein
VATWRADLATLGQVSGYADAPISVSRSLRLVFEACGADTACHVRYPNPLGQLGHLLAKLRAQPVTLEYTDPSTHQQRHAMRVYGKVWAWPMT